ncbi:MAG: LysR family transcriptional regulator [Pseudomonadota bacterium]
MDLLSDLRLFARIVASGSLSAAGREMGLSPGAVSQRLKALERRYAAPLLNRSSRALSLTDEGKTLLQAAHSIIGEADALEAAFARKNQGLVGRLRVAAPSDLGRQLVAPLLLEFAAANAGLCPELHLDDALDDPVSQDFDVTFRYGNLEDSALVGRSIAANRRVVVGAPAYFATHGVPHRPADLRAHKCLVLVRGRERLDRWAFIVDREEVVQAVHATLAVNDGELLRRWAIAGHGIALKSMLDVKADLAAGRLIRVLDDYTPASVGAQILFPSARRDTPRVRAFVDAAIRRCEAFFGD